MKKYYGLFGNIRNCLKHEDLELIFMLDYLASRTIQGIPTRFTDLVRTIHFGTGPTVFRKIQSLFTANYITSIPDENDSRSKHIVVTDDGKNWLAQTEYNVLKKSKDIVSK